MPENYAYLAGSKDPKAVRVYARYQSKYAETVRESDRVIIELVDDLRRRAGGRSMRVLDIGCSTGNLLKHLNRLVPDLELVGGDLVSEQIEENRSNPALEGIEFQQMNLLNLGMEDEFDVVTVNAVWFSMSDDQVRRGIRTVAAALRPGGTMIVFDYFSTFPQSLEIREKSELYPEGLTLHIRPIRLVDDMLEQEGFVGGSFSPFDIPIDLPLDPESRELVSYTIPDAKGRRLQFRGALFQPLYHLVARKT
jgi:SAM-dependent methyltransferase